MPQDQSSLKPHVIRRTLHYRQEKYESALISVIHCEKALDIDPAQRWTLTSPEYYEARMASTEYGYRQALNCLSSAVVQRILELHKMGLPGTCECSQQSLQVLISLHGLGYKQRKKISEGLKKRSKAVNTALNEYNKQADILGRPVLDFQQVIEYTFLSDFELLHHMHDDITQRPWADPLIRSGMISWMKTERAKEEITRLNVEARRLKTYIRDSSVARQRTIQHLCQIDPALAAELQEHHDAQSSINMLLSQQLRKMELLQGFTGWRDLGVRVGSNLEDLGSENDEVSSTVGEDDNTEHWSVADAAVEDDVGDQLYVLDNLCSNSVL